MPATSQAALPHGSTRETSDVASSQAPASAALLAAMGRPLQHDLNNLLTVVFANLDLLRRGLAEGAPRRQLDRVELATRRLDAATRALLDILRRGPGDATTMPPGLAVEALAPLLRIILPAPGALLLALETDLWPARFDRAALDALVLGLACDVAALPGGALAVSAGNRAGTLPDPADAIELRFEVPATVAVADRAAAWPQALCVTVETAATSRLLLRLPRADPPG